MKICPHCQSTYTDDDLKFCLQDGTPLSDYNSSQDWGESETVVAPRRPAAAPPTERWQQQPTEVVIAQPVVEKRKSSPLKIIALTMLGMFALFGIGGLAAWLYTRDNDREIAVNTAPVNSNQRISTPTPSSANLNANLNLNANSNLNTNAKPTPSMTATPTPKPTLQPEEVEQVKSDVSGAIDDWRSTSEVFDLDENMKSYAPEVDYYNGGKVGIAKIRADKQRVYSSYDRIQIDVSNVKIETDPSGEKATATFDKEWLFDNPDKSNSGKVQQQLQFAKINGKWKIITEKDLKVYYVNKN